MPEPATAAPNPSDIGTSPPVGVLLYDHNCIGCGYNLKGLASVGTCPECALPIADSLRGDFLTFASPAYRVGIIRAIWCIIYGILALIGITTIGGMLMAYVVTSFAGRAAFTLAGLIPHAMMLWGAWSLVRPDPGFVGGPGDPLRMRQCTRAGVIVMVLMTVVPLVVSLISPVVSVVSVYGVISVLKIGVWIAMFFTILLYARWIASRIPSKKLTVRAGLYLWLLPLLCAIPVAFAILAGVLGWFGPPSSGPPSAMAVPIAILIGIASLVCWLFAIIGFWILLFTIRRQVQRIHATAAQAVVINAAC